MEGPPADQRCSICHEDRFTFPCRTSCNHWFCAKCILKWWRHGVGVALKPCKCPLCNCNINRLTPEALLHDAQEIEAVEALKNIQQYNRLFVGGAPGLLLRICQLPRRLLRDMVDPNRYHFYYHTIPFYTLLLGILNALSPFHIVTAGGIYAARLIGGCVLALYFILLGVSTYRRLGLLHPPHP